MCVNLLYLCENIEWLRRSEERGCGKCSRTHGNRFGRWGRLGSLTTPPQIHLPPSLPMGKRGRLMEGVSEVEWRKAIVGMEGKQRRLTIGSCTYITHISINVICVYVCMYVSISFPVIPPP